MDYNLRDRAWIWLNSAVGTNVRLADELIFINDGLLPLFDSVRKGKPIRLPASSGESLLDTLKKRSDDRSIDAAISKLDSIGAAAVTRDNADYPNLLREIYDPPTVLFVKGKLKSSIRLPIAVIGSRKCSDYGRSMAERFGRELAKKGACVISGMAEGCDSAAALGALSVKVAEYPTIAVLGSGIDVVYPSSNRKLYDAIAERGAVISELSPGKRPSRESFPQRNRLISGMSKGVLVAEAGLKSGTSITVGFAHDQGRDVFAVPGRITDIMSAGSNQLIKQGAAKAVFGVDDILFEYGVFVIPEEPKKEKSVLSDLSPKQKMIYEELMLGEKTADFLCEKLGFDVSEINIYLTEMELSGIINRLQNGSYSIQSRT
ncbi:MAG: DNA-processing protein DprA [Clostridia bacterium]|nr:DNA-processing protein DprA [Clostridia bacterium]